MTNETLMYIRLGVPCLTVGLLGGVATWVAAAVADLPLRLGAPTSPLADAPLVVMGLATVITASLVAWQGWRIRQWMNGEGPTCPHCGCLMDEAKKRRWSVCHKCLGCGQYTRPN